MTYRNKVTALASTLAGLLLLYAAGLVFAPERNAARAESGRLLYGKPGDVARLAISGGGDADLAFAKTEGGWSLSESGQELPVEASRIQAFLEGLAEIDRLSPRSEGAGDLSGFGFAQGQARHVVARSAAGKVLADFAVGGYGPTGAEIYVRLKGAGPVYSAQSGFASYLREGRPGWLDLRVFPGNLKTDDVQTIKMDARLSLQGGGGAPVVASWSVSRKDGNWTWDQGTLDGASVDAMLRSTLFLSGQDIAAMPPEGAFSTVQGRIALGLGTGETRIMEIGADAGNGSFYLRAQGSPWVYLVSAYSLINVLRPASALAGK